MLLTTDNTLADVSFGLEWRSSEAAHEDRLFLEAVNFWRDYMPSDLHDHLLDLPVGGRVDRPFEKGELFADADPQLVFALRRGQFDGRLIGNPEIIPAAGRFYPRGLLRGVTGIFRVNREPFRLVALEDTQLTVDFNHPLAGRPVHLNARVCEVRPKRVERGGAAQDLVETIAKGPGMQARWRGRCTDFLSGHGLQRIDEQPDPLFYHSPRMVQHLDDTAIGQIVKLYRRLLAGRRRVLDLMSSWQSHLPVDLAFKRVSGLGMNEAEMAANPRLTDYRVHDLNRDPDLPYAAGSFDAVVCAASVEYLIRPAAVFAEIARVLRSGGRFVVVFSNRWFPPKAIRIWRELHEFERMGLVLEYFLSSGSFTDLHTLSVRGLPRPRTDKYAAEMPFSDPLYAVWGDKA